MNQKTKDKISKTLIGLKFSKSRINNIRLSRIGMKHSASTLLKMSTSHIGKKAWNKGLTKEIDKRLLKQGISHSKSMKKRWRDSIFRDRISNLRKIRWSDPKYIKRMERCSFKGWFISRKNEGRIYYQSTLELHAFLKLEKDRKVVKYSRCYFNIPFIYQCHERIYIPDIKVWYSDCSIEIIEVKPECRLFDEINILKFNALKRFCFNRGFKYSIWTQYNIPEYRRI